MKAERLRRRIGAFLHRLFPPPRAAGENDVRRWIKRGARIGHGCRINGRLDGVNPHLIEIGDYCVLGVQSALLTHCPIRGALPVRLGDRVWIGFGVSVLPGVAIGERSVIGAGSVVTRDVPPRSLAAGSPARVLRALTEAECRRIGDALESGQPIGRDVSAARHALVGAPGFWRMKRSFQIEFLRGVGLAPSHRLLDLGCGTLRGGLPLIEYLDVGGYTGLEVRSAALEAARAELAETGLAAKAPELRLVGDLAAVQLDGRFDFIWAFSVLIHMSDPTLEACLAMVQRHLASGGVCYANVNLGHGEWGRWQEFPVVARPREFYEAAAMRHGLAADWSGPLRELGHVSGDPAADAQWMLRLEAK